MKVETTKEENIQETWLIESGLAIMCCMGYKFYISKLKLEQVLEEIKLVEKRNK